MFDYAKFNSDLASGEAFEQEFLTWANKVHGCYYAKEPGNFKDYDIMCTHCRVMVECKSDRLESRTRNFCFELPLLKNSKADYLAYKVWKFKSPDIFEPTPFVYIFQLHKLRKWCRTYYRANPQALVKGGDGNKNQMLLVPKALVRDMNFKIVIHLEKSHKQILFKPVGVPREVI